MMDQTIQARNNIVFSGQMLHGHLYTCLDHHNRRLQHIHLCIDIWVHNKVYHICILTTSNALYRCSLHGNFFLKKNIFHII